MVMFLAACSGGSSSSGTNHCDDSGASSLNLDVTSNDCAFAVNNAFTACGSEQGVSINNLVTNGDILNCDIQESEYSSSDYGCQFNIVSLENDITYICEAGIYSDSSLTGEIYCTDIDTEPGVLSEYSCLIEYN